MMFATGMHAFRRFGFGPQGSEHESADPQGWLRVQMNAPDPLLARVGPSVLTTALADREHNQALKAGIPSNSGMAQLFPEEMTAALRHAVSTDLPLRERLVWFWANHFTVSARAGNWAMGLLGAYIQEAIRPHVTGRFADMVKAVMRHPAMLFYLDNWMSTGPGSPRGRTQHIGLNENLARECLELHTLGVQAGYTQSDVTALAAILTGRTFNREGDSPGFVFTADMHEPGSKKFMGHAFAQGFPGGEAALDWIADHPGTRRHIATQLIRHFVADAPPENCIVRLESVLAETGGDLNHTMLAIIDMSEAWQPLTKFRAPAEYVIAVQRALDLPFEPGYHLLDATRDLGQPFMSPLLPNGWPDTAADWISGEALLKRADWAMTQASRPGAPSADAVIEATIADVVSASTLKAVRSASTPAEALATVFVSPEFLRR